MCNNNRCSGGCNRCEQPCDPCRKQPKIYYCEADIACLDIEKGEDIHRAIKKIGDKLCQVINTESPLTYVNIEDATVEQCPDGGLVFQILQVGSDNLIEEHIFCNSTFDLVVDITYEDLTTLVEAGDLEQGIFYNITNNNIVVQALSNDALSVEGSYTRRIVKNEYYTPATGILGVWKSTLTPTIGDVVVWGGRVWQNTTGNVGSILDDSSLVGTDWTMIPTTNDTYYFDKTFFVLYDFENDWISKMSDDRGNELGISYQLAVLSYTTAYNPVDILDWGNENIFDNKCFYICNNSNNAKIYSNTNHGIITRNSNTSVIAYNSNNGAISNNSNIGYIVNNSNNGGVTNNSNNWNIQDNSNLGTIHLNSNNGQIAYNDNKSYIKNNSNDGAIILNSNNGSIDSNSNIGKIQCNSNNGTVYLNSNNGSISTNSNLGNIYDNTNTDAITNNSNSGDIEGNSNAEISFNSNNGSIFYNQNSGFTMSIYLNSNNGYIHKNVATANINIYNNINNGNIGNTAADTNRATDVTDTITNK